MTATKTPTITAPTPTTTITDVITSKKTVVHHPPDTTITIPDTSCIFSYVDLGTYTTTTTVNQYTYTTTTETLTHQPSHYAACESDNVVSLTPDGQTIDTVYPLGEEVISPRPKTAVDCCILCQNTQQCAFSYFDQKGVCQIVTCFHFFCDGGVDFGFQHTGNGNDTYTVSNAGAQVGWYKNGVPGA